VVIGNRALVLTVDEYGVQTRAIHQRQRARRTLDGRLASAARQELLALHRSAQRLLEPLTIVNPYAPQLTFVDARTRTRRDHEKYLTLIDAVTLLHQHQRERKTVERGGRALTYIEVTPEDITVANRLAAAVLGRSLDELPPQTRRFLEQLDAWIAESCGAKRCHRSDFRFLAREARDVTGLGPTQAKVHLRRLVELEYVLVHRAPRGQGVSYELAYTADPSRRAIFSGLRDVRALDGAAAGHAYDRERPARGGERSASRDDRPEHGRPAAGGMPGHRRSAVALPIVRGASELDAPIVVSAQRASRNGTHPPRGTVPSGARS
jgi:hypothetical protein